MEWEIGVTLLHKVDRNQLMRLIYEWIWWSWPNKPCLMHIQVGDAANMPYNDASFDPLSFFVSCNLAPEAFKKHFQEL